MARVYYEDEPDKGLVLESTSTPFVRPARAVAPVRPVRAAKVLAKSIEKRKVDRHRPKKGPHRMRIPSGWDV